MTTQEWIDLIGVIAWPLVVVILAVVMRRQIGAFLSAVGGRATKVSVMSVSIELAVATEAIPTGDWQSRTGGGDVRGLVPAVFVNDSYFDTLRQSLAAEGSSDYVVVDLKGDTEEWLSSRLYLFSYLLGSLKGVRAVVFVGTRDDVARAYLGLARVHDVLRALEAAQPRFRLARLRFEAQSIGPVPEPVPPGASATGEAGSVVPDDIEEWWRKARDQTFYGEPLDIARQILEVLQYEPPSGGDPPPGWLQLPAASGGPLTWESATWLESSDLTNGVLRDAMLPDAWVVDDRSWDNAERVLAVARTPGEFIALTTATGRFDKLVDRRALVDSLGRYS